MNQEFRRKLRAALVVEKSWHQAELARIEAKLKKLGGVNGTERQG